MLEFRELSDKFKQKLNIIEKNENGFALFDNNNIVGYAFNYEKNNIFIYVIKKYRGNGYGKILFEYILKYLKGFDVKYIEIKCEQNNNVMNKLALEFNGVQIFCDKNDNYYAIPI